MNPIEWLLFVGLALSPFAIVKGYDSRYPKEVICLFIAVAVVLYAVSQGYLQKFKNIWLLILIGALIFFTTQTPQSGIALGQPINGTIIMMERVDVDNLWNFKPLLYMLVYLLMVVAIASIKIRDYKIYFHIMAFTGSITAFFVICQYFSINQYFIVRPYEEIGLVRAPLLTAFLGQYSIAAAFMCFCYIPAIYTKNYLGASLIIAAVIMSTSRMAMFGIGLSTALWFFFRLGWKPFFYISIALLLGGIVAFTFLHLESNGRFGIWKQIIFDMQHPLGNSKQTYGFTGYGAGAFHYYFPIVHSSIAHQAHNEYMEFFFNNGALGVGLLFISLGAFFRDCFQYLSDEMRVIVSMMVISCMLAHGTFFWQIACGGFYTAVLIGLAYNMIQEAA